MTSKLQYDFLVTENTELRKTLRETIMAKDKEIEELRALLGGDLKELPRVDLGSPFVTPKEAKEHYGQNSLRAEEKQALWSDSHDKQQEIEQARKDWVLVK